MRINKLSQKGFTEVCKINVWNLKHVLSDDCHFNMVYLIKIADAMNLDFRNLLKD